MLKSRQTIHLCAKMQDFPRGGIITEHCPDQFQLLWVETGVAIVKEDTGLYVISPGRALFLSSRKPRALRFGPRSKFRAVYFAADTESPPPCVAVRVSGLLHELVLAACTGRYEEKNQRALASLLRSEIARESVPPLHVPEPRSEELSEYCRSYARSMGRANVRQKLRTRTMERLFVAELGMSFRAWRQKVILVRALELLGQGDAVANVAHKLDYASASAFIYAFRRELGCTPGEYFRAAKI